MAGTLSPRDRMLYAPIVDRPRIVWPGQARLAVWIVVNVEHYAYTAQAHPGRDPWPRVPHPDVQQYAFRDYGNRVGLWRLLRVLDALELPVTASLNVGLFASHPHVTAALQERGWAIMGHGIWNTSYLHGMDEDAERAFIRECLDIVDRHGGPSMKGMLGPALTGTPHTPDLLAEAGLRYQADWMHDDQPAPLRVRSGRLISLPYSCELNDVHLFERHWSGEGYEQLLRRQFDVLYEEGETSGRVFCLPLHPYLVGQPHLIGHLEAFLEYCAGQDGVWFTTADALADYYLDHVYDSMLPHFQPLADHA